MHIKADKDPGIFESKTLSNGVTVYFKHADTPFGEPKVAGIILVNVGGRDDPKGREGSAHFFEHMPFRGTAHFPTLKELTEPIENNGGYMNAFTTDESTGYECVVPSTMLEDGIARIHDMLTSPQLRENEIEIEREVIIEELKNKQSNVGWYANQEMMKRLLGDHPIVNAVIGSESSLKSITKTDLANFHAEFYHAGNISLFFAGGFDEDELMALCEKHFGQLKAGPKTVRGLDFMPQRLTEKVITLTPEKYNRSIFSVARVLPPLDMKTGVYWRIFAAMLSRGMTSPLFKAIREDRGLAYNISVHRRNYTDVAMFGISVSTQFKNMDEIDTIVWNVLPVVLDDEDRFNEMKHSITQSAKYAEFTVGGLVDDAVNDVADYGRVVTLDEYLTLLNGMTHEDLKLYIEPLIQKEDYLTIRVDCDKEK